MDSSRSLTLFVRSALGKVAGAGLVVAVLGTACVTPGGNGLRMDGGTATGSGGYIPLNLVKGPLGGAGNETVITAGGTSGNGGISGQGGESGAGGGSAGGSSAGGSSAGGAPVKTACTTPTANYPYSPGYVISPTAVMMAESAVSSMTLSHRADQLRGTNPGAPSSRNFNDIFRTLDAGGVKGFKFRDGPRGVNLAAENPAGAQGYSTTFPVPSSRGASFDLALEYQIGQAMGDETLASGHNMLLSPTTNILRHPLWGRNQETYGEDAFHLGRMGTANVVGIQEYVPACAKHYAANNIEVNRANLNAMMDEQTLQEVYARHFEMMIRDGGVSCIMAAYNSVNGVKSTQNKHLLNELLRDQFGFKGFVMSDWWAMPGGSGNITTDQQKANAAQALLAGLDMELPWNYNYSQLESQVTSNAITQATVSEAALRVVREKFRFNVATGSGVDGLKAPKTTLTAQNSIAGNDANLDLARHAAVEGSVLLKNDNNTLPIVQPGRTVNKVAVIGAKVAWSITGSGLTQSGVVDFANDIRIGDLGSSRTTPDPGKTIGPALGLKLTAPSGVTVTAANAASAARDADFIVVVAGMTQQDEGEEYTGEADRNDFSLDSKVTGAKLQDKLIMDVAAIANDPANKKPWVVVLQGGGVMDMPWIASVPAVVMAWYPGQVGGYAIGQLLFGEVNFSGKLPVTWSSVMDDWPVFSVTGQTTTTMAYHLGYRWFEQKNKKPLYPFGHGLSYTTYRYENVVVPCTDVKPDANIPVTVDVFNTGEMAGEEIVMVFVSYLDPPPAGVQRSVKELKAFRRVHLDKGQGKRVTIDLRASDLKVYDPATKTMKVPTGRVQILVGPSSERTKLLPANDMDLSTVITLVP